MKPRTVSLDNLTGLFDMLKGEQMGEITETRTTKGDWGLKWNELMGKYGDFVKLSRRIADVQGLNSILVGHIVGNYLNLGIDEKGNPQKKLIGWKVDVAGTGAEDILVPFDEVYNLVTIPNAAGTKPQRKLITQPHEINDYPFEAKSRKGITGPIMEPTYEKILKALPAGKDKPLKFLLVGRAGSGKSTLVDTWETPIVHIDLLGGCDEFAKGPDRLVLKPQSSQELYKIMLKLAKTGEI